MKLTFVGAAHEVTGSCHYLEACGKKILVDYGMEQGKDCFENVPLPANAGEIDYVFVTHAHIDHTGLLPLLSERGFTGKIFATSATTDLCGIMLLDSAGIQEFEAEWRNRKGRRKGADTYVPLYTAEDAERAMRLFVKCPYGTYIDVCEGIKIRFTDVGHLLGSASIEVLIDEDGEQRKIAFSGDIGNENQPLLRNPTYLESADYVVMESTYGDRSHGPVVDFKVELAKVLQKTFDRGGNVVIPSFAVGRTQEILYFIRQIKEEGLISGHDGFPVYVDSPLAVRATGIFNEHTYDCFDDEAAALVKSGINPLSFKNLRLALTTDESKEINDIEAPKVIISASGMCEAGRIKHHLKHNLWREDSTVLFAGYQAVGTLGRAILDGAKEVTLFGEDITVACEVLSLPGISGHADNAGLMRWATAFKEKPKKYFIVHGEDEVTELFAARLRDEAHVDAYAPYSGTIFDLVSGEFIKETTGVPIEKKTAASAKAEGVFARLLGAIEKLTAIARAAKGMPNKDLAKFADQVDALAEKWKR